MTGKQDRFFEKSGPDFCRILQKVLNLSVKSDNLIIEYNKYKMWAYRPVDTVYTVDKP